MTGFCADVDARLVETVVELEQRQADRAGEQKQPQRMHVAHAPAGHELQREPARPLDERIERAQDLVVPAKEVVEEIGHEPPHRAVVIGDLCWPHCAQNGPDNSDSQFAQRGDGSSGGAASTAGITGSGTAATTDSAAATAVRGDDDDGFRAFLLGYLDRRAFSLGHLDWHGGEDSAWPGGCRAARLAS